MLATTFAIVAVFMPVGFMGGIIGRFFHQFGITVVGGGADLDVRQLHARPDAVVDLARPVYRRQAQAARWAASSPGSLTAPWLASRRLQAILRWALRAPRAAGERGRGVVRRQLPLVPLLGTEFVPEADLGETGDDLLHAGGLVARLTEAKARQVEAALREFPEVDYTYATINTGSSTGKT